MRVLVVSTNRCREPFPVVPLGACIVAGATTDAGHDVRFLDLMFTRRPIKALRKAVATVRPDVVALSVRNIDNCDMLSPRTYWEPIRHYVRAVRHNSAAKVVLGGSGTSVMPQAVLDYSGADVAVVGEGEGVLVELLAALDRGDAGRAASGLLSSSDSAVLTSSPADFPRWSGRVVQDLEQWVDLRAYGRRGAGLPVQTKRGCPFECVHCTYPLIEGRTYRLAPPEAVVEQVNHARGTGLTHVDFVDSVFNSPYEHALSVCDALASADCGVSLHTYDMSPQFVTPELLHAMERAVFVGFGISAESASDEVLRGLGKSFTGDDVHRAAHAVRECDVPCMWMFLLGGPGETEATVHETLGFASKCLRPGDVAYVGAGIRVYPGTRIAGIAAREGQIQAGPNGMLDPAFYLSPAIDATWLMQTLRRAAARDARIVLPSTLQRAWLVAAQRVGLSLGLHPPLWKYLAPARRLVRWPLWNRCP